MTHQGRPHVLYVGRDITERKAQEARLRGSEEQYRAIFNAADRRAGAARRGVPHRRRQSGLRGAERQPARGGAGQQELTLRVPDDEPRPARGARRALAGRERAPGDRRGAQGRQPLPARGARGADGLPGRAARALHRPRHHRAQARRRSALRASEEQYRAIFNAIDDALVLRDADFRIVDVNRAYEAMSGYARDEVVGERRADLQRARAAASSAARCTGARWPASRCSSRCEGRARTAATSSSRCAWCRSSTAASRTCCRSAATVTARARRRGRARAARGAAAPGAEDGGDRPAHRRHRARLQQHPAGHPRQPGARGRAPGGARATRASAGTWSARSTRRSARAS